MEYKTLIALNELFVSFGDIYTCLVRAKCVSLVGYLFGYEFCLQSLCWLFHALVVLLCVYVHYNNKVYK